MSFFVGCPEAAAARSLPSHVMRSDRALCTHLASALPGTAPFALEPGEILAWSDGPLEAVVRCRVCGACAWLERVERDEQSTPRRFVLAGLCAEDVALYFRNRARGSCDVGRASAELEALAASRGAFERLIALDTETLELSMAAPYVARPERDVR